MQTVFMLTHGFSSRFSLLAGLTLALLLTPLGPASGQSSPATGESTSPAPPGAPRGEERSRHVLLLYTEPRLTPSIVSVDRVLPSMVQARSPVPVYFYT